MIISTDQSQISIKTILSLIERSIHIIQFDPSNNYLGMTLSKLCVKIIIHYLFLKSKQFAKFTSIKHDVKFKPNKHDA